MDCPPDGETSALRTQAEGNPREPEFRLTFVERPFVFVSLVRQIREQAQERKTRPHGGVEAPLPVGDLPPWYRDLAQQVRGLFEKPKVPTIELSSRPVEVPEIWQDYLPNPFSWANSFLVHLLAVTAIVLPFQLQRMLKPVPVPKKLFDTTKLFLNLPNLPGSAERTGGGGGGGHSSPTPASKGAIPRFTRVQYAPPTAKPANLAPLLPVEATLLGPPELKLPEMSLNMPWGDPRGVVGPASDGPGTGGGIGPGDGTGVGSGKGPGYGPGNDGGFGDGPFQVGGAVSAPVPIYRPEPAYSEEARKAKYQGIVMLWIVVDSQGNVQDERVVKSLGMGLDEKAIETVRTWRFQPGKRNGTPVPVRVQVEITFRLF